MITAHAGAESTADNTPESLNTLMRLNVDALEIDVQRLSDGRLALSHDAISELGSVFLLEDALQMVAKKDGLLVNIDCKQTDIVKDAAEIAQRTGMVRRILFTGSVSDDDIRYARDNELTIWYNEALLPAGVDLFDALSDTGLTVLNINWKQVTEEMLMHHAGELSVWTVDELEVQQRFLQAGVKNLTTRRPLQALEIITSKKLSKL